MHFANILFKKPANLSQSNSKKNIFFMHIPKCGGVSIGNAIKWQYYFLYYISMRKQHVLIDIDPVASLNAAKIINDDTLKFRENLLIYFMSKENIKCISGHVGFSETAYNKFHDKFCFLTLLRDPVKRWISLYFYNRYKKSDHCKITSDLKPYMQSEQGKSEGYTYVKYLCGGDKPDDYCSKLAIDRAKKNLDKFDIVGCLEYPENFLTQFQERFGKKLRLKKKNQNPVSESFKKSVITEEDKENIKILCKPDLEIYQYAIDKFVQVNHEFKNIC